MIVLWIIYGIIIGFELLLILTFQFRFKKEDASSKLEESVSVLIAARDEEQNLKRCLDSLLNSNCDFSRVEILVGDDNSEDDTWRIIQRYAQKHPQIVGVKILDQKDGLIAKGNVLAQLVDEAKHDKLLIIDADMAVSEDWLNQMSGLLDHYDLISGYTTIAARANKGAIQYFDWSVVLHSMKAMADLFKPISILGNNMGFNRRAYNDVGGWRGLGPTDVEDLGLLRHFQKEGKATFQYVGDMGRAETLPQLTFREMLTQRCRWMNGVFTHHWLVGIPALFARLWFPVFLFTLAFDSNLHLLILGYAIVINQIKFLQMMTSGGGVKIFNPFSPVIISLLDTFALLRLIFVGKVSWKGRKF